MTYTAVPFVVSFTITIGIALAQGAEDPMTELRACSLMDREERLQCLDRLSRAGAPPTRTAPADNWIVSETTSPVDYSPIATATASSRAGSGGSGMQLSIRCRGGRTELVLVGPLQGRADEYAISFRVDDGPPAQVAAAAPMFGTGIAFKDDIVRLLQSLPNTGNLNVHISSRARAGQDAVFALAGLEAVRVKMAAACKWPRTVTKPRT